MKKTLRSVFTLTLILLLALSVCACGSKEPIQGTLELPATPMADPVESVTLSEAEHAELMEAYRLTLQDFAFNHILPDGTTFELGEGFGYMEENAFAIYDVDSDGVEELMIQFTTAPTAGMFEGVYHYVDGAVTEAVVSFPGSTYYLNNVIMCPWSHNQSFGPGDFWPYSVCAYRAETDTFEYVSHVAAWDKTVSETSFNGDEPFPTEKDDGSGVVYQVTSAEDASTEVFSQTEFDLWEQLTFGGSPTHWIPSESSDEAAAGTALFHNIPWQDMTETNINALAEAD